MFYDDHKCPQNLDGVYEQAVGVYRPDRAELVLY
jgi:hypothetical protein